jgi:DNA repair photolyase
MAIKPIEIEAKTILTPQGVGSLSGGYDYSLNPYAGCAFGCSYCYVPKFPNARHEGKDWGTWVEVKINAPQLIARDRLKVFGSRIFFSSATDPYQYLELKYRLSRRCLQMLLLYKPEFITMHTRSHLILQDIGLLKKFGKRLRVGVSIPTDDEYIKQQFEPNAPSIKRRLELITMLHEADINVHASLSPLLPCNADRLVELVKPYVRRIWIDSIHWLEINNKPELLKEYSGFFNTKNYRQTIEYIKTSFYNSR